MLVNFTKDDNLTLYGIAAQYSKHLIETGFMEQLSKEFRKFGYDIVPAHVADAAFNEKMNNENQGY